MGLKVGAADVQDVKLGATQVAKVMLGSEQVWPVGPSGPAGSLGAWIAGTDYRPKPGRDPGHVGTYGTDQQLEMHSIDADGRTVDLSSVTHLWLRRRSDGVTWELDAGQPPGFVHGFYYWDVEFIQAATPPVNFKDIFSDNDLLELFDHQPP